MHKPGGKVTVVIPAYNVSKYITRCLDSIVNQTVERFRAIIIDDGSTDNTSEICKAYAEKYSHILSYVYQENKGLGAARNTGLAMVETPYVCFLDSDDWQDLYFIQKVLQRIEHLGYMPDMIFTLPVCYNEVSHAVNDWMDKPLFEQVFGVQNGKSDVCTNGRLCPELYLLEVNANRKIYRTDFLRENQFAFPEGVKWEDIRPHVQLVHKANSIVGMAETGFIYRTQSAGQITSGTGAGRLDIISVFDDLLSEIEKEEYLDSELAVILRLICKYTLWMIDCTNTEYMERLLDGLHSVFMRLPDSMINAFEREQPWDEKEKNKYSQLRICLAGDDYKSKLMNYEDRSASYYYWSKGGAAKKRNKIAGGIQCIKDSGLKYTFKLALSKIRRGRA